MSVIIPDQSFIERNYNKTIELIETFKLDNLKKLIEDYSEEYATAPASTKKEYHCAFPGGLCYHNLYVLQWIGKLAGAMTPKGSSFFDKTSLLKLAILHNIGKIGEKEKPYYIPTTEQWEKDRGIFYKINPDLSYMKIPQRSLFLASRANVELTQDEYLAILLSDGMLDETNRHYNYKESKLATLLHYAVYWARRLEAEKEVKYP